MGSSSLTHTSLLPGPRLLIWPQKPSSASSKAGSKAQTFEDTVPPKTSEKPITVAGAVITVIKVMSGFIIADDGLFFSLRKKRIY